MSGPHGKSQYKMYGVAPSGVDFLICCSFIQGMDLAYLQTGIRGVFFFFGGVVEFRQSVVFWYW